MELEPCCVSVTGARDACAASVGSRLSQTDPNPPDLIGLRALRQGREDSVLRIRPCLLADRAVAYDFNPHSVPWARREPARRPIEAVDW